MILEIDNKNNDLIVNLPSIKLKISKPLYILKIK